MVGLPVKDGGVIPNGAWLSVHLGDALLSQPILNELQHRLSAIYEQQKRSEQMAAFYQHFSKGIHCHLTVYLTDEFQQFVKLENATRCNTPNLKVLGFLAGNPDWGRRKC